MNGRPAILAEGLEKSYGTTRALRGLDLEVEEGTIFGLLGPNGAGKTTAVRILTTLLKPDAGRARVAGFDIVRQADELLERFDLADAGRGWSRPTPAACGAGSTSPPA